MNLIENIFDRIESDDRPHHVANLILRTCNVLLPPIKIEAIIAKLGLNLVKDSTLEANGLLDARENPPVIKINSSQNSLKTRFTMAHELGHFFIHAKDHPILFQDIDTIYSNPDFGDQKIEREANEFAASLLVPLWLLEPLVSYGKYSFQKLTEIFQVSETLLNFQLRKLI